MSKLKINAANLATKSTTTIVDNLFAGVTSLTKVAAEETLDTEYYSDKAVGQIALGMFVGGAVVGYKFGDRIPLFNKLK